MEFSSKTRNELIKVRKGTERLREWEPASVCRVPVILTDTGSGLGVFGALPLTLRLPIAGSLRSPCTTGSQYLEVC